MRVIKRLADKALSLVTETVEYGPNANMGVDMAKQAQRKAKVERQATLKSSREGSVPVVVRSRSRAFTGPRFRITPKTPKLLR